MEGSVGRGDAGDGGQRVSVLKGKGGVSVSLIAWSDHKSMRVMSGTGAG